MTVTDAMVEAATDAHWSCNPHLPLKEKMRLALEAGIAKAPEIADAPDMAAALADLLDFCGDWYGSGTADSEPMEDQFEKEVIVIAARAALRKAGVYPEVTK